LHPPETVAEVLALREAGLGARRISAKTGIAVRTVSDWISGHAPRRQGNSGDGRCARCGAPSHLIADAANYAFLLGSYLGDGYIAAHPRGVFRLRIVLDERYPEIVERCVASIESLIPNKVRAFPRKGCVEVRTYSKAWPCLLPQVGPGRKHGRRIALASWQRFFAEEHAQDLLRGLVESDGCRFMNQGRNGWRSPRYSFANKSQDIQRLFRDTCDLLGLHWTEAPDTTYVSRKADVARMDEFIGPKR
jgi:hypothetical protein